MPWRSRPAPGRVICNIRLSEEILGTLGCFVTRKAPWFRRLLRYPDPVYILSCNHVLARRYAWSREGGWPGNPVIDYVDGPSPIARLTAWSRLRLHPFPVPTPGISDGDKGLADAAIALLPNPQDCNNPFRSIAHAKAGNEVWVDLIDGPRSGVVVGPAYHGVVFKHGDKHCVALRHLFEIRGDDGDDFALQGDSGAAVYRNTENGRQVVGLLIGIAPEARISYAIPIDTVLDALGVRLLVGEPRLGG
jgi:hypothetical protein